MMFAEKPIKTGDEILNYYGSLPSSDVLRKYGYVSDGYWDFDVVEIDSMEFARTAMVQLGIFDEEMLERVMSSSTNHKYSV
jgi:SET domain-containing protein 6